MARYHILFGFDEQDIVRTIVNAVKKQKHEVEFSTAVTKQDIRDYLQRHKTVTTLILREVMGTESYTAEELAQLNDVNNYNIIVVVDSGHRGQPFMQALYSAGITSAILLGEKSGASPATIADLVLNQRSRKKARDYYGMTSVNSKVDILTSDLYTEKLAMLTNQAIGVNIIDRFVQVVRRLTVNQAVDFTAKLPPNIKRELMEYEEYYKVLEYFRRNGYKVTVGKRPKNLKKGLSDEVFLTALSSKKKQAPRRVVQPVRVQKPQQPVQQVQRVPQKPIIPEPVRVKEEPVERAPLGMSMASMLGVDQDILGNESQVVEIVEEVPVAQEQIPVVPDTEVEHLSQGTNQMPRKTVKPGSVQVVGTSSAFNKGKKKNKKTRAKTHINWRTILLILGFGILGLILWYFTLSLIRII